MTEEALHWAKSTVWSRAFNIPYLGVRSHLTAFRHSSYIWYAYLWAFLLFVLPCDCRLCWLAALLF